MKNRKKRVGVKKAFEPTDNHFAQNLDVFFKNPEFDENKEGFLEGPGMRRLHHKNEDHSSRVKKTLAEAPVEFELDVNEDEPELVKVRKDPNEIFQSDEYKARMKGEENEINSPNPTSTQPRLYCHYNKAEVATIGVADVVPPGTKKLKRFRF